MPESSTTARTPLLPCPFCGGEAKAYRRQDESLWSHEIVWWSNVGCDQCDFSVNLCDDEHYAKAAEFWNLRTSSVPSSPEATTPPCENCQHVGITLAMIKATLLVRGYSHSDGCADEENCTCGAAARIALLEFIESRSAPMLARHAASRSPVEELPADDLKDAERFRAIERHLLRVSPDGMDGWIVRGARQDLGMRQGYRNFGAHRLAEAIDEALASRPLPESPK